MTTQTEALKLAISRLEWFIDAYPHDITTSKEEFLQPFKEALAQPEQEPVEWGVDWGKDGNSVSIIKRLAGGGIEVVGWEYAPHPPQRTTAEGEDSKAWVGLTDEETAELVHRYAFYELARQIEAKLKEKNT